MKRYSILTREHGHGYELELCQVDSNPDNIVAAAAEKLKWVDDGERRMRVPRYDTIRAIENTEA